MLQQSDVAHYLVSLGIVKARDVVEDELTIVDRSRRNRVFVVSTGRDRAYVVKQAGTRGEASLAHEVATLRELARTRQLADRVPAVVLYDAGAALAVFSTPAGAHDWTVHHRRRFPTLGARALGHTLAVLHGTHVNGLAQLHDPLWALQLTEPSRELLLDMSTGAQELVARVQADRMLCDRLDAVHGTISTDSFVHGDVRWDNCLAIARRGGRRRTNVILVDWESAGPGPAAVDTGTVFAEYLAAWVESVPLADPRDPGRLLDSATRPLRLIQPAIRAFWDAYRSARRGPLSLRSVVELAGVRMLHTAVERAQEVVTPTAHVMAHAQLAANLLRSPEDAARILLGLQEP
jgi:hypothetical protein